MASALGGELGLAFGRGRGGPGGWIVLDEPELHLGDDILVPDVAGWRRERMPVVPDEYFCLPPDWICEVLSKSTEHIDRLEKMPVYASFGVAHAWLVSPRMRSIETFRLVDNNWMSAGIYKDPVRARIAPFDAIELDLAALWADIPLPSRATEAAAQYDIW